MHVHARNGSASLPAHTDSSPEVTPTWASVLDLDGGYYSIADLVWHHLDIVSIIRLSKTCSVLAASLKRVYRTRWKLESLLENFLEDAPAFRRLMRSTGAVISGHSAADFVYGSAIEGVVHGVLKIFVVEARADVICEHLDSYERHLERLQPHFLFGDSPVRSWRTRKLFDSRSHPRGQSRTIRLRLVKSDALLETANAVSNTRSLNFITWDRAICLFPGPSLTVKHWIPQRSRTIVSESLDMVSATGVSFQLRLENGHDAGGLQVDRPQTIPAVGKAIFRKKATYMWSEFHRERSFGDSYSWLVPFENMSDRTELSTSRVAERSHELCFFSLPELHYDALDRNITELHGIPRFGLRTRASQNRELGQATTPLVYRADDAAFPYLSLPGSFKLDMNLCTFPLLNHIYSWTGRGSWPDMYNTSQRFFEHFVPSRMEHLCLREAARTAREDLPACWPVSPPLEPTPVFVRCLMRHVSNMGFAPAHWRRYDDELAQWYKEFRSGARCLRKFGPPVGKEVFWCDAVEPDRLQTVQRVDRGAVCCKQWQEDYLRFLTVIRQAPSTHKGAKPSWDQLFLSE